MHSLFEGVDEILHAGDVCGAEILIELGTLAPVYAVRGNCDHDDTGHLPEFLVRGYGSQTVLMTHILERPERMRKVVADKIAASGAGLVIYGHTHRFAQTTRDGVLYINPGSAGSPRHGLPATVAILEASDGPPHCTILNLDGETV